MARACRRVGLALVAIGERLEGESPKSKNPVPKSILDDLDQEFRDTWWGTTTIGGS